MLCLVVVVVVVVYVVVVVVGVVVVFVVVFVVLVVFVVAFVVVGVFGMNPRWDGELGCAKILGQSIFFREVQSRSSCERSKPTIVNMRVPPLLYSCVAVVLVIKRRAV